MTLAEHCIDHWHKAVPEYRARLAAAVRKAELIFGNNMVDKHDVKIFVDYINEIKPAPLPKYAGPETQAELTLQWPAVAKKEPNYKAMAAEAIEKIRSYQNLY